MREISEQDAQDELSVADNGKYFGGDVRKFEIKGDCFDGCVKQAIKILHELDAPIRHGKRFEQAHLSVASTGEYMGMFRGIFFSAEQNSS